MNRPSEKDDPPRAAWRWTGLLRRRMGAIAEAVVQLAPQIIQASSQPARGVVDESRARLARGGAVWGAVTSEAGCDAARECQEVGAAALAVAPDEWLLQCRGGARARDREDGAEYQGCSVNWPVSIGALPC